MQVEFYKHDLNQDDINEVVNVLHSVFLTTGPVCAEFERRLTQYTGIAHTVSLNSCTAALHLAMQALGIGPGHEVITTPMTFIATATAILHAGAKPVFVDIDPATGLIDPNRVEDAVNHRTKAILPVHLYGTMADMQALRTIADRHHLYLIEDAAHCIEGVRSGIRPGEVSDAVCYSFYATKNLTCGEGGALATNNYQLAQRVRILRQHGMSTEAADRYHGAYRHWDMVELGWKYNLDDIRAALLINQIYRLQDNHRRRCDLYQKYYQHIAGIESVSLPDIEGTSAHHLFTIHVPEKIRDTLLQMLGNENIGVAVNYRAVHCLRWFRQHFNFAANDFPNARALGEKTISLPFYPSLTEEQVGAIVQRLEKCLAALL